MAENIEYIIAEDSVTANNCRVCDDKAIFDLTKNTFAVNDTDVLLLTAFNTFSGHDNVSIPTRAISMLSLRKIHFFSIFFSPSIPSMTRYIYVHRAPTA